MWSHGGTHAAADGPCEAARAEARTGLYVHVPFCATRCTYCDFSTGALSAAALERYLRALEREVVRRAPAAAGARFTSVFFGGGTPSSLSSRDFGRVGSLLRGHFAIARDAEITLEANPESVRPALLDAWAAAGVNRLSMGAQSFHADELERLGRIHDASRPARALELARAHGFRRLSLDLMFGFPGHTVARWTATLETALDCDPGHLSAYCFIPESGTPLGDAVARGAAELPLPEVQAECYALLTARLARAGYGCYETSNFCRPQEEARHNLVYWLRRPCLALGPSAHGYWGGARYGNHRALAHWAAALEADRLPVAEVEPECESSMAEEIVMLGLRLGSGLQPADYPEPEWRAVARRYGEALVAARRAGRIQPSDSGWRIAARHRFLADDVIGWIAARAERTGFDRDRACSLPSLSCPILPSPAI